MPLPKRILVPTDFGEAAEAALDYAKTLAEASGASLHLLHVMDDPLLRWNLPENVSPFPLIRKTVEQESQKRLENLLSDDERRKFHAEVLAEWGGPQGRILDYVNEHEIDLIVMGTHGRGAIGHALMGNVAERVVRHAPCPVLVIRSQRAQETARDDSDP